jgi:hypothetical protein
VSSSPKKSAPLPLPAALGCPRKLMPHSSTMSLPPSCRSATLTTSLSLSQRQTLKGDTRLSKNPTPPQRRSASPARTSRA